MSSWLKQLSKVDNRTKHSVYGWIREAESELNIGYVPHMIRSICVLYFRDDEIFGSVSEKDSLCSNQKTMTKSDSWEECRGYGFIEIPSMDNVICRWDLKIHKSGLEEEIFFGIASKNTALEVNGHQPFRTLRYLFHNGETGLKSVGTNDTVSLCLNLDKDNITYLVNNKEQSISYKN